MLALCIHHVTYNHEWKSHDPAVKQPAHFTRKEKSNHELNGGDSHHEDTPRFLVKHRKRLSAIATVFHGGYFGAAAKRQPRVGLSVPQVRPIENVALFLCPIALLFGFRIGSITTVRYFLNRAFS